MRALSQDWERFLNGSGGADGDGFSEHALIFRYEACERYLREGGELHDYATDRSNMLDLEPFRFGHLYRCTQSFKANGSGRIGHNRDDADAGETMWFTGWSSHAWDALTAFFFCDLDGARELVFADCFEGREGTINKEFKENPLAYFEEIEDGSEFGAALMELREEIVRRRAMTQREAAEDDVLSGSDEGHLPKPSMTPTDPGDVQR